MNVNPKVIKYLVIPVVLLLVSMTIFTPLPSDIKLIIRIALIILFFGFWRYFMKKDIKELKDLSFVMVALNLAFLIVTPFTADFWNLNQHSSRGFALMKLSDSLIISTVLISTFLIAGYNLKSIYLTKGRLIPGLIIGIVFFLLLGYLAFNNPQQKPEPGFLGKNWGWVLIFVSANGFMEELMYRGIILERLNVIYKPAWSIFLSSVCFSVPHLTVSYQPNVVLFAGIVFILGVICGSAMYYTKSIIAPAIIHAGADLMIIIPIFSTYGVNG